MPVRFQISDLRLQISGLLALLALQGSAQSPAFTYQKVMIPVRDGVKLETVIMSPANATAPLPILFRRTPYGVPADANGIADGSLKELARDGYIFVVQNLRGRFGSEGTFELSSKADVENPKATSETSDAYDSIDWLVKNVRNNNGKVGMFGVSYDGLTAAMTLLRPHPALKAISEQASPADQWMNDDDHRYGALRESYAFEYAVYEQADKHANTHFDFETYDTYSWYLKLGPLSNINAKYLHGSIPYWNSIVEHPDYDAFWKDEAWVTQVKGAFVPNLNVAGFWDQEDPWGPWEIYRRSEASDPNRYNFIVAGPWFHGQWHNQNADLDRPGVVRRPRHGGRVPRKDRGAVVPLLAARQGREVSVEGVDVPDRVEHLADLRRVAAEGDRHQRLPARQRHELTFSRRRPATATCSTSPIRPTRCRIAPVRSRRPIQPATGGGGKLPISASSTTVPTSRPGSARRSSVTSPSPANCPRICSRRRQGPTAISSSS